MIALNFLLKAALRRTMEKETRTTRFCLVCNYVSRIIDPITSRCTKFRFTPLNKDKIIERLKFICEAEQLTIEDKALNSIVEISDGDLRRAITTLQVAVPKQSFYLNKTTLNIFRPAIVLNAAQIQQTTLLQTSIS